MSVIVRLQRCVGANVALCDRRGDFVAAPPECLEWDMRKFRILEEIVSVRPDVICMQGACAHKWGVLAVC